jgi:hypothetical protein
MVFGLALVGALVLGVASMAMSATGKPLILGKQNDANKVTKLIRHGAGVALSLEVQDGQPPMKVNSSGKVANLNSDLLDGKSDTDFAAAYKSTVVVSPMGTDTENGTALLDALSSITDASATKRYLLSIEPGTYDLGNGSLSMKQWVDIQGSGELNTAIVSGVSDQDCFRHPGTVNGADNAELRLLTVTNTGTGNCNAAISNNSASPRLTYVTASASGGSGGIHFSVYNLNSNPTMTNVTATASGAFQNDGVHNVGSSPTIKQSTLIGDGNSLVQRNGGTGKVANTQLVGPVYTENGGSVQCIGNYNDNLAAVSCP